MEEREYNFIIDPNRGKKWFVFYTKIRPWLAVAYGVWSLLALIIILIIPEEYDYPFWSIVILASRIAHAVLSVLVFAKSFGDCFELVQFIKIVLLFETIYVPTTTFISEATIGDGLGSAVVYGLIAAALYYLLWYRLNVKYFDSRLVCTNPPTDDERYIYELERLGLVSQSEKKPETVEQLLNEYGITVTYDESANDAGECEKNKKANYCRKCGTKLQEDAIFCSNCGTKAN